MTKYGFKIEDWNIAKAEAKDLLIQRAKARGMMPYSELTNMMQTIRLEPNSPALAALLGEISEEEDAAGRGLLTVIVVHKIGDMQPGPGYFELAKLRGRDTSDILKCWIEELKYVNRIWSWGINPRQRRVRGGSFSGTIPFTPLRQFYSELRNDPRYDVYKTHLLAMSTPEGVAKFAQMLDESFRHFESYRNPEEAFHRRTDPDWFGHCRDFAKALVFRLRPSEGVIHAVTGISPGGVRAVDYEISAYRTTGSACFEGGGGYSESGKGGLDLLLQNVRSGLPLIGEAKAVGDTNVFLAFVQAITYAVELVTPSQTERLSNTYNEFSDMKQGVGAGRCEVALFFPEGSTPRLLGETTTFIRSLARSASVFLKEHVERVVFIAATLPANGGVHLRSTNEIRCGQC